MFLVGCGIRQPRFGDVLAKVLLHISLREAFRDYIATSCAQYLDDIQIMCRSSFRKVLRCDSDEYQLASISAEEKKKKQCND